MLSLERSDKLIESTSLLLLSVGTLKYLNESNRSISKCVKFNLNLGLSMSASLALLRLYKEIKN